jgi:hypothetical protein
MDSLPIRHRLRRLWNKFRVLGFKQALGSVLSFFRPKSQYAFPLAGADPDLILASGVSAIRDYARRRKGETKREEAGKDLPKYFPFEYVHSNGTRMRYAFFPALSESNGLVVIFHGYLGFEIYPIRYSWKNFDLLLPLDSFGWKGLGSWFWGEKGSNHVEDASWGLIDKVRTDLGAKRWFSIGTSMGGFAALYHGIKYVADGIYVMTPIIDLKAKIRDYQSRNMQTSYTELVAPADEKLDGVPDIYREAKQAGTLPPLFLIQNQYDRSNPFGEDTLPLLQIYNEKKAWNGLRIQPSIGHQGHDGGYDEAQYFFNLIATKLPPRRVDFYEQDAGL